MTHTQLNGIAPVEGHSNDVQGDAEHDSIDEPLRGCNRTCLASDSHHDIPAKAVLV